MKIMKLSLVMLLVLSLMLTMGCSKNMDAESLAKQMITDVEEGKAYKLVYKDMETYDVTEIYRDKDGNLKLVFMYDETNTQDEMYYVDEAYTIIIEGEILTDYEESDAKELVDSYLEYAAYYLNDTLQVFDVTIEADVVDVKDDNLYMAVGEYDDGTDYYYSYGKDGDMFKYLDDYEEVVLTFDDALVIEVPAE